MVFRWCIGSKNFPLGAATTELFAQPPSPKNKNVPEINLMVPYGTVLTVLLPNICIYPIHRTVEQVVKVILHKAASPPRVFNLIRQVAPMYTPSNTWFPGSISSSRPKQHLDRFSRFCRAHDRDRPTDRQTDHATRSVTVGRIYVRSTAMRRKNG